MDRPWRFVPFPANITMARSVSRGTTPVPASNGSILRSVKDRPPPSHWRTWPAMYNGHLPAVLRGKPAEGVGEAALQDAKCADIQRLSKVREVRRVSVKDEECGLSSSYWCSMDQS